MKESDAWKGLSVSRRGKESGRRCVINDGSL
jgi:hypothetical protein